MMRVTVPVADEKLPIKAEYEFGSGGNKAAKLFTIAERGAVKHKYTRRKVVWDCIQRQINS